MMKTRDNDNIVHIVDSPQVCGKILVESSHAQLNSTQHCSAISREPHMPPLAPSLILSLVGFQCTHYVAEAHPSMWMVRDFLLASKKQ